MQFPTTRLMLVRHGETEANIAGRMQGRGDDPLTERGRQQVRAIAERLKLEAPTIAAVYSSPLLRAQSTADQIATTLGVEVRLRDGLQEMHLGDFEGVSASELRAVVPATPEERYPGGESAREFVERIMGTFGGLVAVHPGETIVAVSHGGVISTVLSIWSVGHGGAWRDYIPENCALSVIDFSPGPRVITLNDSVHL